VDTPSSSSLLSSLWIPVGTPGFSGAAKAERRRVLDERFGSDGWRYAHVVRGAVVSVADALVEYEAAYHRYLRAHPELVEFLVRECGNVYDSEIANVYDDHYEQPHTAMNHYQDIAVRRVVSSLVDDDGAWPDVVDTVAGEADLVDSASGEVHRVPRARGFRGHCLLEIRDPESLGYCLSPAVVPVHDPALITTLPSTVGWYHHEGCAHLSVEAFWQMSKVVEVRYDRFVALGPGRLRPLDGLG
jgi:hypothetical protein